MGQKLNIIQCSLISLVAFTVMAIFIRGGEPTEYIIVILSIGTFLFGIFGSEIMQNRNQRLDNLREYIRKNNAMYISIYRISEIFGKEVHSRVQQLIDKYLIETMDHKLKEFSCSNNEFLRLFDYVKNIKPKNEQQIEAYQVLLSCINQANEQRKQIEYLVHNDMHKFKWLPLIGPLAAILFSILWINNNSISSIIITVLLSTSSIIFLLIIRDADSLVWKKQRWLWEPVDELFIDLDLLPYYPYKIIQSRRVCLKKGTKIRVAYYQKPYPDMRGKTVKIEAFC